MENTVNEWIQTIDKVIEATGDNRFRRTPTSEVKEEVKEEPETAKISAAERMYTKHLRNVKKYQQNNPEKIKVKSKRYMVKLKEDKERYAAYLKKRRIYYSNVLKPNKEKKQEEAHESLPTTLVI